MKSKQIFNWLTRRKMFVFQIINDKKVKTNKIALPR